MKVMGKFWRGGYIVKVVAWFWSWWVHYRASTVNRLSTLENRVHNWAWNRIHSEMTMTGPTRLKHFWVMWANGTTRPIWDRVVPIWDVCVCVCVFVQLWNRAIVRIMHNAVMLSWSHSFPYMILILYFVTVKAPKLKLTRSQDTDPKLQVLS